MLTYKNELIVIVHRKDSNLTNENDRDGVRICQGDVQ